MIYNLRGQLTVHSCGSLINRAAHDLPAVCRLTQQVRCSNGVRVAHERNVQTLQAVGAETTPHKVHAGSDAEDGAVNTPLGGETCLVSVARERGGAALEDVLSLVATALCGTGGVVDPPFRVDPVELCHVLVYSHISTIGIESGVHSTRSPEIAGAAGRAVGPHGGGRGRPEPRDGGGARQLDVGPCGGGQVVVAAGVDNVRVTAVGVFEGICEAGCTRERGEAHEGGGEKGEELHGGGGGGGEETGSWSGGRGLYRVGRGELDRDLRSVGADSLCGDQGCGV